MATALSSRSHSAVPFISPHELTGRTSGHIVQLAESGLRLHHAVADPFRALVAAAGGAGIVLSGVSGFRDFEHQLSIWNGKFRGQRAVLDREGRPVAVERLAAAERVRALLTWSALPGASRHHWGTDVDVIDRAALADGQRFELSPSEYAADGPFARLGEWLDANCERFGFYRPYDVDRGGVQPEPWHLSYAPLAAPALADLSLPVLAEALETAPIEGREAVVAALPEIYRHYVLAVAAPSALALAPVVSRAARPS
jgi:LAS superfamily LD-carboxypeptidase LdcB